MNLERIPFCGRVLPKVKAWFNPQAVDDSMVRGLILGTLATIVMAELSAYRIIEQDMMSGNLNIYTIDFVIIGLSLLEVLMGPFVSWLGYNNRRMVILGWNVATAVICLFWLVMPGSSQVTESEYCQGNNAMARNTTTSSQAGVRLSLMIISGVVLCLTRVAIWSHGIAYIDEHAPTRISLNFGILVAFRLISLTVFNKIIPRDQSISMQVFPIAGSAVGNIVQVFLYMPKNLPRAEPDLGMAWTKREFLKSMGRVFKNTLAMSQMVGIGLLAAALWGFTYHDAEIVKVKYHIDVINGQNFSSNLRLILQNLVVIMSVLYVGLKFSSPILPEFCRFRGMKQATFISVLGLVFYVLLTTLGSCDKGNVAGLDRNHYTSPVCNLGCGCIPRWREFSPVCVVDQATTYLSPCQAGCSSSENVNNIQVFTNCTCALASGSGRAARGACSLNNCSQGYELHQTLFIMVVVTTVLAFQAQGVVLLRMVEPRDRSLALGVAGSVVSSIAFGCGHLIYLGISAANCRWFEAGRCHLYSQSFPRYIGFTSAVLVIISIAISITVWVSMKLAERQRMKNEILTTPEERVLMDG